MGQKLLRLSQLILVIAMVLGGVSLLLGRDVWISGIAIMPIMILMIESAIQYDLMMSQESPRLREMRRRLKEADSDADLSGLHPDEWEGDQ